MQFAQLSYHFIKVFLVLWLMMILEMLFSQALNDLIDQNGSVLSDLLAKFNLFRVVLKVQNLQKLFTQNIFRTLIVVDVGSLDF
mgnify:CR=1 FL=1